MTNEELRARLWEVEKELAESRHVLEILIRQHMESQMVVGAVLPFIPKMITKMNANTLQQYKGKVEQLAKSIRELPESD
jgi:tRNA A22 N-methylase